MLTLKTDIKKAIIVFVIVDSSDGRNPVHNFLLHNPFIIFFFCSPNLERNASQTF